MQYLQNSKLCKKIHNKQNLKILNNNRDGITDFFPSASASKIAQHNIYGSCLFVYLSKCLTSLTLVLVLTFSQIIQRDQEIIYWHL